MAAAGLPERNDSKRNDKGSSNNSSSANEKATAFRWAVSNDVCAPTGPSGPCRATVLMCAHRLSPRARVERPSCLDLESGMHCDLGLRSRLDFPCCLLCPIRAKFKNGGLLLSSIRASSSLRFCLQPCPPHLPPEPQPQPKLSRFF